nr:MAG: hypothetical protein DIU78_09385 [Pseudomonadota bacterium]
MGCIARPTTEILPRSTSSKRKDADETLEDDVARTRAGDEQLGSRGLLREGRRVGRLPLCPFAEKASVEVRATGAAYEVSPERLPRIVAFLRFAAIAR